MKIQLSSSVINSNFILTALSLFLISNYLHCQTYDNNLWYGLNLDIPVTKKIELSVSPEIRKYNDMTFVDWYIIDLGAGYKINKNFKASFIYRYKFQSEDWKDALLLETSDAWQHQIYFIGGYNEKFGKLNFSADLKYNKKFKFEYNKKHTKIKPREDEEHIRNKFKIEYDTDFIIKPFLSAELFYLIRNDQYSDRFDVVRYYFGIKVDTFKDQNFTFYYMQEKEFNIDNPKITNVLGIFYSIDLPRIF